MLAKNLVVAALLLAVSLETVTSKIFVCYYGTWAAFRPSYGKFEVDNIDPTLCTHYVYAFAGIYENGTVSILQPELALPEGLNAYTKFTSLKEQNPELKTLLAVGGWGEGSANYSTMAASAELRQNFINSSIELLNTYDFDGYDIDWEYPNQRDTTNGEADVDNFSTLLKEMKEELNKYNKTLSIAVAAVESSASLSYDIPTVSNYVDWINVMAYDFYGSWDNATGLNAPLYAGENNETFNVDAAITYWLGAGCPAEKLILGLPLYGRTYTLANASDSGIGAPISGDGFAGPYTQSNATIGYNEFCVLLLNETWDIREDTQAKAVYAVQDSYWVTYETTETLATKVEYALSRDLGGVMVWSIETDDFHAFCHNETFPLLKTIKRTLNGTS